MKYRKCLWCGDFFWAQTCEKTYSENCAHQRKLEQTRKSDRKKRAMMARIREEVYAKQVDQHAGR